MLLDTGSGREEVPALVKQAMTLLDVQSIACFVLTHHHRDHTDGVSSLRDAISQSSSFAIYKVPDQHSDPTWLALQDGQAFSLQQGKQSLKVIQTPGHTADSICLQWREGPRLLGIFTADTVLGHGSSVYEDLSAYMSSLDKLQTMLEECQPQSIALFPGHGEVREDGLKTVREYRQHRIDRENEIIAVLRDTPATLDEYVSFAFLQQLQSSLTHFGADCSAASILTFPNRSCQQRSEACSCTSTNSSSKAEHSFCLTIATL